MPADGLPEARWGMSLPISSAIYAGADGGIPQYDKFSKYSKCELFAWCRGCPAVASGTYGSFYSEDLQCWKII